MIWAFLLRREVFQVFLPNTKEEMRMKGELSKEEEELAEMVAINDDDIYPMAGKRWRLWLCKVHYFRTLWGSVTVMRWRYNQDGQVHPAWEWHVPHWTRFEQEERKQCGPSSHHWLLPSAWLSGFSIVICFLLWLLWTNDKTDTGCTMWRFTRTWPVPTLIADSIGATQGGGAPELDLPRHRGGARGRRPGGPLQRCYDCRRCAQVIIVIISSFCIVFCRSHSIYKSNYY